MPIYLSCRGSLAFIIVPLLTSYLHAATARPGNLSQRSLLNFERLINSPVMPHIASRDSQLPYPVLKQNLMEHLMLPYRRYERPTESAHEPTRVRVSIKILAITSVDVINMQYTTDMVLIQTWRDARLQWHHLPKYQSIFGDILLTHKRNDIWLPDLFFRNGKDGFLYRMTVLNHMIRVSPGGEIYYSQKITMKLACEMHLRNFPMDQQDCDMDIGSYGYTIDQLKFIWDEENALKFAEGMQISEFNTPSTVVTEDCTAPQTTSTGTYSCLLGRFQLKRQIGSYLVGTYVPAFLIVIVSWLTFWVSPDAIPARVTLGLLTLISLLTKIASLNTTLPRVSYIKAIDIWLIACLIFVIAAMLEFTLASYWSRKVFVSKWRDQMRNSVRTALAKVVCPCRSSKPDRILLRCTCCGIINRRCHKPEFSNTLNEDPSSQTNELNCTCVQNRYRTVKFDVPFESSNRVNCNQVYDNKGARDCSPHSATRQRNEFPGSNPRNHDRATGGDAKSTDIAARSKVLRFQRSHQISPPSTDIPMSTLSSRRRKQKITSCHSGGRRNCRNTDSALCPRHPLPQRYLRVREVEINDSSNSQTEDDDLNSEIDAYSRFLFPCCYILYNCAYWGFYLIILDPVFTT